MNHSTIRLNGSAIQLNHTTIGMNHRMIRQDCPVMYRDRELFRMLGRASQRNCAPLYLRRPAIQ
jgi:hypothetical protein